MLWFLIFACANQVGLSEEGRTAKLALQAALEERRPETVSRAARDASQWKEQDPQLDRMLGDALANVLMKPEEGLVLLQENPAVGDSSWTQAVLSAAVRHGDSAVLQTVQEHAGSTTVVPSPALLQQLAIRARADPTLEWSTMLPWMESCALLDGRPTRGRQALDLPAPDNLKAAAIALGATHFAVGRPPSSADPDPLSGRGDPRCSRLVLLPSGTLPKRIARTAVVAAAGPDGSVFLEVRETLGERWLIAASNAEAGARWFRAAAILSAGGNEDDVRMELGAGLHPPDEIPG